MKADVSYNDFVGTVAADISDVVSEYAGDTLKSIGKHFKLDEDRFELIGLSLYGLNVFNISLICIDHRKSTEEKKKIVSMNYDINENKESLDILFKRLHIMLYSKYDDKTPSLEYDEEIRFSDFHSTLSDK